MSNFVFLVCCPYSEQVLFVIKRNDKLRSQFQAQALLKLWAQSWPKSRSGKCSSPPGQKLPPRRFI